jgi:secreted PhoX family phosphatase
MTFSRRSFVTRAAQVAAAVPALNVLGACATNPALADFRLQPDPQGLVELPPGFSYVAFGRTGEAMSDGFFTPSNHDGMAAFPVAGDPSRCIVVRNHEIGAGRERTGAFGEDHGLAARVDPSLIFDFTASGRPLLGGTTTFIYNTRTKQLEQSFLSLAGTATNCAGGPTPWGSWLTCEETQEAPGANAGKLHGYVFEVPSSARGLVRPVALEAMGRFRHEACAIDPATGIVYETEDDRDGLFYRFLPAAPGALERGGRLQALVIREQPGLDTRNWGSGPSIAVGQGFRAAWVDLQDVTAPDGDLRLRGRASGAAVFARGEGVCTAIERGQAVIYFTCTTGGAAQRGQVWRLEPSVDGDDALSLFAESSGEAHFDMVDNIEPAPWGDLIMAEDGGGENFVRGLTPRGVVYPIMRNALNESEFCGPCFSPDGSTLFVNIQNPGITLAVSGPWETLARSARNA